MLYEKEFLVLCDDGEEHIIYAETTLKAMTEAAELGYRPVEAVEAEEVDPTPEEEGEPPITWLERANQIKPR